MSGMTATKPFDEALISAGPSPELGEAASLYESLIGNWDVKAVDYEPDGSRRTAEGEWVFAWALEGRAIQDIFIVPRRSERGRSLPPKGNRYGTTVRFYDRASGQWLITWINPVNGSLNQLAARGEGNAIVQTGTDPDGTMRRWCFVDITPDSFRWTGEESGDGGKTWQLGSEFFARRRK